MSSQSSSIYISNDPTSFDYNDSRGSTPISPKSSPLTLQSQSTDSENFCINQNLVPRFSFLFNEKSIPSPSTLSPLPHEQVDPNLDGEEFLPILSQSWRPCTGDTTIGHYLDHSHFPISFRDLVYRWTALQRPNLQNLRIPLNLRNKKSQIATSSRSQIHLSSQIDLQEICEAQERNVIESIEENFERGFTSQSRLFIAFASHLDIYCAVHAELKCLEDGINDLRIQYVIYEEAWQNFLQAFDLDRTICVARPEHHDCLGYLLYGEVYFWPITEIQRRFEIYRTRSSSIQKPLMQSDFLLDTLSCQEPLAGSSNGESHQISRSPCSGLTPSLSLPTSLGISGISFGESNPGSISEWSRNFLSDPNVSSTPSMSSLDSSAFNTIGDISPKIPGTPWMQQECQLNTIDSRLKTKKGHSSMPIQDENTWRNALSFIQNDQLSQIQQCDQNEQYNENTKQLIQKLPDSTPLSLNELPQSISSPDVLQQLNNRHPFSVPTTPTTKSFHELDSKFSFQNINHKRTRESETISESIINQLAKRMDRRMSIEKVSTDLQLDEVNSDGLKDKKFDRFGKMLKDIATQLETAVRMMGSTQNSQQIGAEDSRADDNSSIEAQEDRLHFSNSNLRRPSRPRSHTTDSQIHQSLQKIIKAMEGENDSIN